LDKHDWARIADVNAKEKFRGLRLIPRCWLGLWAARDGIEQFAVQFVRIGGKLQGRSKQGVEAEAR
jgi:hypothetical protein